MKNFVVCSSLIILLACSAKPAATPATNVAPPAVLLSGTWSPTVTGVATTNYKNTAVITKKTITAANLPMVRFNDGWTAKEVTVDLGVLTGFGQNGSLTLTADAVNYPYAGGAYPVLASFSVVPTAGGGTIEFVNTSSGCSSSGMWTCSGGSCDANPACSVQAPSSFFNRIDWDQHQVPPYGYTTTNSFPRCDSTVDNWSACPANQNVLPDGHYYAKYVMMSDSASSVASGTVGLSVKVTEKQDAGARALASGIGGAVNLNVILVGDQNISDSHTAKGTQNLNMLFQEVNSILQTNANVGVGNIKVYEWSNANGGDQYSTVQYSDLGSLFSAGSTGIPATDEGSYLNIFIVSDIAYSGGGFIILGLSGAIQGPTTNGTYTSGLAFSTSNQLATFNPGCTTATCARGFLENDFLEMGATIAHEMGHYLGLNHPSEKPDSYGNQSHDQLPDTPTCAARNTGYSLTLDQRACFITDSTAQTGVGGGGGGTCQSACNTEIAAAVGSGTYLTTSYVSATIDPVTGLSGDMPANFCPHTKECEFNHTMWYTTKNRQLSSGSAWGGAWSEDGDQFSDDSKTIMQWNSFVR
jgi:hypothetical protein